MSLCTQSPDLLCLLLGKAEGFPGCSLKPLYDPQEIEILSVSCRVNQRIERSITPTLHQALPQLLHQSTQLHDICRRMKQSQHEQDAPWVSSYVYSPVHPS